VRARLIEHLVQSECTAVVYGTIVLDLGEAAALLMAQLLRKLLYKFEVPFSTMLCIHPYRYEYMVQLYLYLFWCWSLTCTLLMQHTLLAVDQFHLRFQ
jgi:hypothetical protein